MKTFSQRIEQINEFGLVVTGLIILAIPLMIRFARNTISGIDKKLGDFWNWTFNTSWHESLENELVMIKEDEDLSANDKKTMQKYYEQTKDLEFCPMPLTANSSGKTKNIVKTFFNLKSGAFYDLNKDFFESKGFNNLKSLIEKKKELLNINEAPYYPNYTLILKMPDFGTEVDFSNEETKKNFKPSLIGGMNGISLNYFNEEFIKREKERQDKNYSVQELDYMKDSMYIISFIINPKLYNDSSLEKVIKNTINQYVSLCKKQKLSKILILSQKDDKINSILKSMNFLSMKEIFEKRQVAGLFKFNILSYEINPKQEEEKAKELGQIE